MKCFLIYTSWCSSGWPRILAFLPRTRTPVMGTLYNSCQSPSLGLGLVSETQACYLGHWFHVGKEWPPPYPPRRHGSPHCIPCDFWNETETLNGLPATPCTLTPCFFCPAPSHPGEGVSGSNCLVLPPYWSHAWLLRTVIAGIPHLFGIGTECSEWGCWTPVLEKLKEQAGDLNNVLDREFLR